MKKLITLLALVVSCNVFAQDGDALVKGATNPAVTQENIQSTICVHNYTATIRPSASYTNKLKRTQMAAFHLEGTPSEYEEDHLISLELGGNPTSPDNLWPQKWVGEYNAHMKDQLENKLHKLVCAGTLALAEAQKEISENWIAAYNKYINVSHVVNVPVGSVSQR